MRGSHRRYGAYEDRMLQRIERKRALLATLKELVRDQRSLDQRKIASAILLKSGCLRIRKTARPAS